MILHTDEEEGGILTKFTTPPFLSTREVNNIPTKEEEEALWWT